MANKDVELRITARDSSRKTFQQLSKTVQELTATMTAQQAASEKGEVSADALEKSFKKLESAGAALAKQSALVDLYNHQSAAMDKAKASGDTLRKSAAELNAQIGRGGTATKEQTAELKRLETAIKKADSATVRQENAMARTSARLERLGVDTAAMGAAQDSMVTDVTAANRALDAQTATIDKHNQARYKMVQALKASAQQALSSRAGTESLARAQGKLTSDTGTLATELKGLLDPASQSRVALGSLEKTIGEMGAKISAIKGPVKDLNGLLADMAKNQKAIISTSGLVDSFRDQTAAVKAARAEFQLARTKVRELAKAIQDSNNPTQRMGDELTRAQARLRESGAEFSRLAAAARKSQAALKGAGVDTRNLASETERLRRLSQEASGQSESLTASIRRYGQATGDARKRTDLFNDSGRKTLSWMQRMRGEVLSLVAAYAGLNASIAVVGDAIDVYQKRQAITTTLIAVVGDDSARLKSEWEYIKDVSASLRQDTTGIGKAYADFSVSMKEAGMETQNTRFIFESFTKAGLALKRTPEQMERVMYALTQMGSKGKVMSEELVQQLGDVMPGILGQMANALGMTGEELSKTMAQPGGLALESLQNLAEYLNTQYAASVDVAKNSLQSSLNSMKNSWSELLIVVADGGLADALQDVSDRMTDFLRTEDAEAFAISVGAAMTSVGDAAIFLMENVDGLIGIFKILIGMKVATFLLNFSALAGQGAAQALNFARTLKTLRVSALSGAGGVKILSLALKGLTRAIPILGQLLILWDVGKMLITQTEMGKKAVAAFTDYVQAAWMSLKGFFSGGSASFSTNLKKVKDERARALAEAKKMKAEEDEFAGTAKPSTGGFDKQDQADKALQKELDKRATRLDKANYAEQMRQKKNSLAGRKQLIADQYADMLARAKIAKDGGKMLAQVNAMILREQAIEEDKFRREQASKSGTRGNREVNRAEKLAARLAAIHADLNSKLSKTGDRPDYAVVEQDKVNAALAKMVDLQRQVNQLKGSAKTAAQAELDTIVKLTTEYTKLASKRNESARLKSEVDGLLKIRDLRLQILQNQLKLGAINAQEYEAQREELKAATASGIGEATMSMEAFVEANKAAFDPVQYEEYLAFLSKVNTDLATASNGLSDMENKMVGMGLDGAMGAMDVGLTSLRDSFAGLIMQTESFSDVFVNLGTAMAKFFSDLLLQIAQAIVKQMLLNAISGALGGGGGVGGAIGKAAGSMAAGVSHTGSVIGHGSSSQGHRSVSPAVFAGAPRFHSGGLPGLAPDEVPTILQKGEEVLTRDDGRNVLNGGKNGGGGGNTRVVLVDDQSRIADAMAGAEGERVIIQTLRRNIPTLRGLVNR